MSKYLLNDLHSSYSRLWIGIGGSRVLILIFVYNGWIHDCFSCSNSQCMVFSSMHLDYMCVRWDCGPPNHVLSGASLCGCSGMRFAGYAPAEIRCLERRDKNQRQRLKTAECPYIQYPICLHKSEVVRNEYLSISNVLLIGINSSCNVDDVCTCTTYSCGQSMMTSTGLPWSFPKPIVFQLDSKHQVYKGVNPKIGVFTPKMDGENNGKSY